MRPFVRVTLQLFLSILRSGLKIISELVQTHTNPRRFDIDLSKVEPDPDISRGFNVCTVTAFLGFKFSLV
jgi:hypothetical protein